MLYTQVQNQIIAILFAAGEPVELDRFVSALEYPPQEMEQHLSDLRALLEDQDFPLELRRMDDSYQLCSRPIYGELIRHTLELGRNTPLSSASLEALAIVAYNQPVTRAFIDQIRGVDSTAVLASLAEKGLVEEAGRLELPGRPIAYRTTPNFLRCFDMEDLSQLPPVDVRDRDGRPIQVDDGQLDFASLAEGEPEEEFPQQQLDE